MLVQCIVSKVSLTALNQSYRFALKEDKVLLSFPLIQNVLILQVLNPGNLACKLQCFNIYLTDCQVPLKKRKIIKQNRG